MKSDVIIELNLSFKNSHMGACTKKSGLTFLTFKDILYLVNNISGHFRVEP